MLTVFWYNLTQPWLFCAMHVHVNKRFTSCVWTSFIIKYFLPMELNITFIMKVNLWSVLFLVGVYTIDTNHNQYIQELCRLWTMTWNEGVCVLLHNSILSCFTQQPETTRWESYAILLAPASDLKFVNLILYCVWVITGRNFESGGW